MWNNYLNYFAVVETLNVSFPAPVLRSPNRKYNFLDAGEGRGDELYGVEPASYYLKNLFLNTTLAFPLAVALPLLALLLYPMADKVIAQGKCDRPWGLHGPGRLQWDHHADDFP